MHGASPERVAGGRNQEKTRKERWEWGRVTDLLVGRDKWFSDRVM